MGKPFTFNVKSFFRRQTWGTETSHYPQEKKTKVIPLVVASERGAAQTNIVSALLGL